MDEMAADLELARRVQLSLLPKNHVTVAGWSVAYSYEPFRVVSGDYLDVIASGDDAFYFALGDVSGKGVAASLLMSYLHAAVRALLPMGLALDEVVRRVSRNFCESSLPAQFATLVLGLAERSGMVTLVNAGHTPVVAIGTRGAEAVSATSLPLGMFCATEFQTVCLDLGEGGVLLIYSDGVSEALEAGGTGDWWRRLGDGSEGRAGDLVSDVAARLAQCADTVSDDCTVVVLSRPRRR